MTVALNVTVDRKSATRGFRAIQRVLDNPSPMLSIAGRILRDDVRRRIITQDGGSWAPISKWVTAKTRKRKPLSGLGSGVRTAKASENTQIVYFEGTSDETGRPVSLTEHHTGATLPATGGLVGIKVKAPAALGLRPGTTMFWFIHRKDSKVPARRVWPDRPGEAEGKIAPPVSKWLHDKIEEVLK